MKEYFCYAQHYSFLQIETGFKYIKKSDYAKMVKLLIPTFFIRLNIVEKYSPLYLEEDEALDYFTVDKCKDKIGLVRFIFHLRAAYINQY